jgi:hypothetical protein
MSKSQMKTMLIAFFDGKAIVQFEFTPQGQTVNQAYYMEIPKRLREAVGKKGMNYGQAVGFSTMTLLQLTRRSVKQLLA